MSNSSNRQRKQVIEDLATKWSKVDHECPFAKPTQKRICKFKDNDLFNENDCKKCIINHIHI